ncbi:MAG: hypothetical protein H6922_00110, partial [Pseudomonadaceae bacterium]|nr:hypothetical protein [Pseudomonadaceae bacterium]
ALANTHFDASRFMLAEALVVAATILAAGLTASALMHSSAPRWRLLSALLLATVLARALSWTLLFGTAHTFDWLTAGALGGLVLGALVLSAALKVPRRFWPAGAALATLGLIALVNTIPPNPFFSDWLGAWRPGQFEHLVDLGRWLSAAWPYLLLVALGVQALRGPAR